MIPIQLKHVVVWSNWIIPAPSREYETCLCMKRLRKAIFYPSSQNNVLFVKNGCISNYLTEFTDHSTPAVPLNHKCERKSRLWSTAFLPTKELHRLLFNDWLSSTRDCCFFARSGASCVFFVSAGQLWRWSRRVRSVRIMGFLQGGGVQERRIPQLSYGFLWFPKKPSSS